MDTTQQLAEIATRACLIPDVLSSIMGISGITYGPVSTSATLSLDGPSERALSRAQGVQSILDPLVDLVHEWAGVRGETVTRPMTGQPATWLHGQCAWAEKYYPGWRDAQQTISEVHGKLGNICGWGPDRSDRQCPHCLTNKQLKQLGANHVRIQRWPTDHGNPDLWTCPTCHHAWIITDTHDGLADSERALLAEQHVLMRPSQAARLLGIDRRRIHDWTTRGRLTVEDGMVYLDDTRALAMQLPRAA